MPIEARIRSWYYEAQRQGIRLDSILVHPDDYWRNRSSLRFLPIRVIGGMNTSLASSFALPCASADRTVGVFFPAVPGRRWSEELSYEVEHD